MLELGMHTDNWRERIGNLQIAVESAVQHELSFIEFGTIHGQYFVHGLGYEPSVSPAVRFPSVAGSMQTTSKGVSNT